MTDTKTPLEREIILEDEALSLGVDRYRHMLTIKGHTDTGPGQRLMRLAIDPLTTAITNYIAKGTGGRAGKRVLAATLLADVDPQSIALLTCRVVLQGVSDRKSATAVANVLGFMLAEHIDWLKLRKEERGLALKVERQLAKTPNERHRRRVCSHVLSQYCPMSRVNWSKADTIKVGMTLLELAVQSTNLIEYRKVKQGPRKYANYVFATDETQTFLEAGHARCELLSPVYMPMVIQPKPWTSPSNGGYYRRRNWLVKTTNKAYQDELQNVDLTEVYSAVNAIQNTAWRVNKSLLSVMEQAWAANDRVAGLPNRENEPLPGKPVNFESDLEIQKMWKREAAKVYEGRAQKVSQIVSMTRKLHLADKFKDEPELFFPHTLDWRGRLYPLPVDMQPQGDDSAKALLQFAEGKRIGEEGASYLYIHVANLFGVDKVSFGDRIKWTSENMEQLIECAAMPMATTLWLEADKPWQALAACLELASFSINGYDHITRLPIAMDGSCNGLQNLSAMLLDEEGGKATNLVPADKPQDIYTLVLDRTTEKLKALIESGDLDEEEHVKATGWLTTGLNRKIVKRPVMTKPYGVTMFGMRDQIAGEIRKQKLFKDELIFPMATFIARLVNAAIGEIVVASKEVMDWLQECAQVAAADNLPIYWTTPCGLPVLQDYRNVNSNMIKIRIGGQQRLLRVNEENTDINAKRQSAGMSPNVIHSLDASHLMKTVNLAAAEGITSFAMVHDSYATHACDIGDLNMYLRYAFVEIYSKDVLGDLLDQFKGQVTPTIAEQMPTPPAKGSLDLNQVEKSLYFFA